LVPQNIAARIKEISVSIAALFLPSVTRSDSTAQVQGSLITLEPTKLMLREHRTMSWSLSTAGSQ
jgi:hypothetical protein